MPPLKSNKKAAPAKTKPAAEVTNDHGLAFKVGDRVKVTGGRLMANVERFDGRLAMLDDGRIIHVNELVHYAGAANKAEARAAIEAKQPVTPPAPEEPQTAVTNADGMTFRVRDRVHVASSARVQVVTQFTGPLAVLADGSVVNVNHLRLATAESTPPAPPAPKKEKTDNGAERRLQWQYRHPSGRFGVVRIKNGEEDDYLVQVCGPVTFTMTKLTDPQAVVTYTVEIGGTLRCGCPGFKNRKACRHVEAMAVSRAQGKI